MLTIKIRTWGCTICGYRQDFEPSQENANKHFNRDPKFKVNNLSANACPSCALKGIKGTMEKTVVDDDKIIVRFCDKEDDKAVIMAELEAQPTKEGETAEQKATRIDAAVNDIKIASSKEISDFRAIYEDV